MEEFKYIEVDIDPERRKEIDKVVDKIKDVWLQYLFVFDNKEQREAIANDLEELLIPKKIGASIYSPMSFDDYSKDALHFVGQLQVEYRGERYPLNDLVNFWFLRWITVK